MSGRCWCAGGGEVGGGRGVQGVGGVAEDMDMDDVEV